MILHTARFLCVIYTEICINATAEWRLIFKFGTVGGGIYAQKPRLNLFYPRACLWAGSRAGSTCARNVMTTKNRRSSVWPTAWSTLWPEAHSSWWRTTSQRQAFWATSMAALIHCWKTVCWALLVCRQESADLALVHRPTHKWGAKYQPLYSRAQLNSP